MEQNNEPNVNPIDEEGGDAEQDRFMYFIRTGEFEV